MCEDFAFAHRISQIRNQPEGWLSAPALATEIINESEVSVSHDCRPSTATNVSRAKWQRIFATFA